MKNQHGGEMMTKSLSLFFIVFFLCTNVYADKVKNVYVCGNDVGIEMETDGWVVAKESTIGEKPLNRILSIALVLLSTQKETGYYNMGEPISWCGIQDAKPITVLMIKR